MSLQNKILNDTWVTFFHVTFTDECHNHDRCPGSSCFYKKAMFKGSS